MENDEKFRAVETALGTPFGLAYDENTLKTRRNLLIAGAVGVLIWHAGLKVEPASADVQAVSLIFGMTVKGVKHETFLYGLLVATSYLLLHFLWSSIDGVNEFRLRASGTRVAHQTGMVWGADENDYPTDPRQSTLYHWWLSGNRGMQRFPSKFSEAEQRLNVANKLLQDLVDKHDDPASQNLNNAILRAVADINPCLTDLTQKIETLQKLIQSERIPVSLKRFDSAFKLHSMSQNARWFALDFGFPTLVGFSGIACTTVSILAAKTT